MMNLAGKCPYEFYCNDGSHGFSVLNGTSLRLLPSYLGIVSATLSLLGSSLIVCSYCAFKDLRKGSAQTIITAVAVADLGTSLSLLLGIFNFLVYDHYHSATAERRDTLCLNFNTVCQIQAFVAIGFSLSSYIWTSVLAINFLLSAFSRAHWSSRLMPLYTIMAWTLPLVLLLPLLITGRLGYTPTYQSSCYISSEAVRHDLSSALSKAEHLALRSVQATLGVITVVCYIVIFIYMCSKRHEVHPAQRIAKRLLAIPIAYLFLMLWEVVQAGLGITTPREPLACSPNHRIQVASFVISILQVTFSYAGQGWINCILYIFLSPELRKRMFVLPFKRCIRRCKRHRPTHINPSSEGDPLIANTRNTPSTRAKARERGDTYFSFPVETPETAI